MTLDSKSDLDSPNTAESSRLTPPVPRPVEGLARRRSWTEPRVRAWWLGGLFLLAVAVYFTSQGWIAWNDQTSLIEHGTPLEAKVFAVHDDNQYLRLPGKSVDPTKEVILQFPWQGAVHETRPALVIGHHGFLTVNDILQIRVSPKDPEHWTEQTRVGPISDYVLGGLLVLPVALVLLALASLARRRVLRTWKYGNEVTAIALECRNTPLAPHSRWVRCTPADESDSRMFFVYVPQRGGVIAEGSVVSILAMPGSASAVAAGWFW